MKLRNGEKHLDVVKNIMREPFQLGDVVKYNGGARYVVVQKVSVGGLLSSVLIVKMRGNGENHIEVHAPFNKISWCDCIQKPKEHYRNVMFKHLYIR